MRVTIYSATSKPILRKSLSYALSLVRDLSADLINPDNPHEGVKLRGINVMRKECMISMAAGSGFDTAWGIRQSGFAGPLVWQLKTQRAAML